MGSRSKVNGQVQRPLRETRRLIDMHSWGGGGLFLHSMHWKRSFLGNDYDDGDAERGVSESADAPYGDLCVHPYIRLVYIENYIVICMKVSILYRVAFRSGTKLNSRSGTGFQLNICPLAFAASITNFSSIFFSTYTLFCVYITLPYTYRAKEYEVRNKNSNTNSV